MVRDDGHLEPACQLLNQRQAEVVSFYRSLGDQMNRYSYLTEMSCMIEPFPEECRTDEYLVKGCQSNVWMAVELDDFGGLRILADSDSFIVKGVLVVLIDLLTGMPPSSIRSFQFTFLEDTGLDSLFSPERKNGVAALLSEIKKFAACNG